ncbi:MAG: hypothetical protein AABW49_00945 [Nanoarchaeota archaeon]
MQEKYSEKKSNQSSDPYAYGVDQPKLDINQPKEIPEELKKKLETLKKDLDKFTSEILKKFDKHIIGIALFPPDRNAKPEEKDNINVFVLVDDDIDTKIQRKDLEVKLFSVIDKIGHDINGKLFPQTMLLSELKEACFDGKFDLLQMIGWSALLYDKGMLGAIKVSEIHKGMSIRRFERYVLSYVAAGSLFRGDANPHDIDVFVVIDDTDVKRMSRFELKEKLRSIILTMGAEASAIAGVKAQFHVQTYILTDFWELIKEANPVIYTFLRDGVPLYDRGVFMPWKLLLKMGRVKPSPEAIDMNMDLGERLLERTRHKMISIVGDDLYYAMLNPAQAALMLYGLSPPTPKEAASLMEEIFVRKEKILEQKYVDILRKVISFFKDIEHNKIKNVQGKEIDTFLSEADMYLKRIRKLFDQIDKRSQMSSVKDTYDTVVKTARDALEVSNVKGITSTNLVSLFKKELVDKGKLPEKMLRTLKNVIKSKNDFDQKKITKQEIEKMRRESKDYMRVLVDFIQSIRLRDLEKAKIRFKYDDVIGEALLLDKKVFLIADTRNPDDIQQADLVDGKIKNIRKSSTAELEGYLKGTIIPAAVFIKESIFEDLRKLFGKEVEIMVSS